MEPFLINEKSLYRETSGKDKGKDWRGSASRKGGGAIAMTRKSYKFIGSKTKNDFLNIYTMTGSLSKAADKAGISRQCHYNWLKNDKDGKYHAAYKEACEVLTSTLEETAFERATVGRTETLYYKGKKIGTRNIPSDKLLMFLLQANRPEKYKQVMAEINNNVNVDMGEIVSKARQRAKEEDADERAG